MHFHHLKLFYLSKGRNEQKRYVPFMRCAICYTWEYYCCIAFLSRHCRSSSGRWGRICYNCLDDCWLSCILFFMIESPVLSKKISCRGFQLPTPNFVFSFYLFISFVNSELFFRLVVLSRPNNLVCPVILAITRSMGEMNSCLFQVY